MAIDPKPDAVFPLDWPSTAVHRKLYPLMRGGYTGCMVVSPDLEVEYANSGSGMVWELFDAAGYDAGKFGSMLDRATTRFEAEEKIRKDGTLGEEERTRKMKESRAEMARTLSGEGAGQWPPKGFKPEHAIELFRLAGADFLK